jgi:hypothetical protein
MDNNFSGLNDLINYLNANIKLSTPLQRIYIDYDATIKFNADRFVSRVREVQNLVDDIDGKLAKMLDPDIYRKIKSTDISFMNKIEMANKIVHATVSVLATVAGVAVIAAISSGLILGAAVAAIGVIATGAVAGIVVGVLFLGIDMIAGAIIGAIERDKLNEAIKEIDYVLDNFEPASKKFQKQILRVVVILEDNMLETDMPRKKEDINGVDLMREARPLFDQLLYSFRECHEVCFDSNLFSTETILEVDQCAIDFRQMSLTTITIATRLSSQWLSTALMVFQNIDKIVSPTEMILLLGRQAQDLAQCFKVISAWANDLGKRFDQAQDDTIRNVKEFKILFQEALDRAEDVKKQIQEEYKRASALREEAEANENKWAIARVALIWCPIGLFVTSIGAKKAGEKLAEAREIEKKAAEMLRKVRNELQEKKSQNDKAKFIAIKAGMLIQVIEKMEETCEAVAAFWTVEAQNYNSQVEAMKINTAEVRQTMKGAVIDKNIKAWIEQKRFMEQFVADMSVICNSYNFETTAKRPKTQSITFVNLDLTLRVPSTITWQP